MEAIEIFWASPVRDPGPTPVDALGPWGYPVAFMKRHVLVCAFTVIAASLALAQKAAPAGGRIVLGQIESGRSVVFVRTAPGSWGIEVGGPRGARFSQKQPVWIELYMGDKDIRQLAAGYASVERSGCRGCLEDFDPALYKELAAKLRQQ